MDLACVLSRGRRRLLIATVIALENLRLGTIGCMLPLARLLAVVSVIAVAAVAVACGGGDEASPEEFRAQANKICAESEQAVERLGEPSSPEQAGEVLEEADKTLQRARERLEDLETPEGETGEQAERYVELFGQQTEQASGALEDLREGIESEDAEQLQQAGKQLQELEQNEEIDRLARELKLDQCM